MITLVNQQVSVIKNAPRCPIGIYNEQTIRIEPATGHMVIHREDEALIVLFGGWHIDARYAPLHPTEEAALHLGPGRASLAVEAGATNPFGTSYVRFLVGDYEMYYWESQEWESHPEDVMGAIFGCMFELATNREITLLPDVTARRTFDRWNDYNHRVYPVARRAPPRGLPRVEPPRGLRRARER